MCFKHAGKPPHPRGRDDVPTFSRHLGDVLLCPQGHVAEVGEDDEAGEKAGEAVDGHSDEAVAGTNQCTL